MAFTPTPAEFKTRFPEFANVSDAEIQTQLDRALAYLPEDRWGCYYEDGVYLLAAHFLAIKIAREASGGSGGSAGSVSSRKVGDVTVTFARLPSGSASQDFYMSTPYGQEWWVLMRLVGMGAVAIA
jgi:hypothetical protein